MTPGFVTALAYSPDGSLLASANGFPGGPVHIWDPAAGRLVRSIGSHSTSRNPMAFAPGGRLLATADEDGTVKFWSVTTGRRWRAWMARPTSSVAWRSRPTVGPSPRSATTMMSGCGTRPKSSETRPITQRIAEATVHDEGAMRP